MDAPRKFGEHEKWSENKKWETGDHFLQNSTYLAKMSE